jgi:hypothetical protein
MTRNPTNPRTGNVVFRSGGATIHAQAAYRSNRADCWQWAPVIFGETGRARPTETRKRISGEPIFSTIPLQAGTHSLELLPRDTIVAGVALVPEEEAKTFSGWGELPEGTLVCMASAAAVKGDAWTTRQPDRAPAELIVKSLNSEPTAFAVETFSFNSRFCGQQFVTLPRAKLVKREKDAGFLTLLYPRLTDMETPRIERRKDGAVITWEKATDRIDISRRNILVRRRHRDEDREEIFRYRRPAF